MNIYSNWRKNMGRGKYLREKLKGASSKQKKILSYLEETTPKTLEEIEKALFPTDQHTWSKRVWLTRTMARLRERSLIKSLGRNSRAQHLWIRINND
jgi:hypothetical protein